ncbi:MAG: ATP-binding protein [Parachlamydiaceae bacterium]|nr:ATP-binding protein [Parachlamydiaceae bacterium]
MNKKSFSAELEQLHAMLKFIEKESKAREIQPSLIDKIILAAEEALVNVIDYSYPSGQGLIEIFCEDSHERKGFVVIIKDYGVPFDPLKQTYKHSDLSKVKDSQALGGYGIYIFIGVMDKVEYQRNTDGNQLTLVKYLD